MKCPKCGYLGFDSGERCKNCGYDFSLIPQPPADGARRTPSSHPQTDPGFRDPHLARGARYRRTDGSPTPAGADRPLAANAEAAPIDLPLFGDDMPPVLPPPRPPLAVRRATPTPSRVRVRHETPPRDALPLVPDDPVAQRPAIAAVSHDAAPAPVAEHAPPTHQAPAGAPPGRRLAAAAIDLALIAGIDAGVLYFTVRLCGLSTLELDVLPVIPLVAFFLVLNGGYLVLFTGTLGQTLGKMATDLEV
ncbi:MAG: RDD family protein, partial [Acidobacteria bacterium]|nr:RDD family protein [Acidobacteriota bacterium]